MRWEFDEKTGDRSSSVNEVAFGPKLTDPDQVSDRVSRAQLALLNPGLESNSLVHKHMADPVPSYIHLSLSLRPLL